MWVGFVKVPGELVSTLSMVGAKSSLLLQPPSPLVNDYPIPVGKDVFGKAPGFPPYPRPPTPSKTRFLVPKNRGFSGERPGFLDQKT